MTRLEQELRAYAEELARSLPGEETTEAYEELLRNMYDAMERHHGAETLAQMSDTTVLKVIRSQVSELIRFKRIGKLMGKRGNV